MNRLSDNTRERSRMLRLGLQFFAEDTGDCGGTSDESAGGGTDVSPEEESSDTATAKDGSIQSCYDAMTREERADFLKKNGLLHHTAATARYKSATDKAAKLDGLRESFAELAKIYGVDEEDHGAILRAAIDRPLRVERETRGMDEKNRGDTLGKSPDPLHSAEEAKERKAEGETTQSHLTLEDDTAQLTQEETARLREAELARMTRQEEETRAAYPRFDFGTASRNPAFRAMVDAGIPMRIAYESAFHTELSAVAIAAARAQARAEALAEYRASGARPEEGAATSTGEAIMTVNYRSMTKEQLKAAEKKYL